MPSVLISGARAPVCLDLARAFSALGWQVHLLDFQRFPLARFSNSCHRYWRLPSPVFSSDFSREFLGLLESLRPDLVVPTCEELFWLRHSYSGPQLFCPQLPQLLEVHHKLAFVQLCQRLGLEVPPSSLVRRFSDRQHQEFVCSSDGRLPLVLKPAFSRFGFEQKLRPTWAEVKATLDGTRDWVCQAFVEGQSYCSFSVARAGQLQAHACYRPLLRLNQGAAVAIEAIDHPQILEWTRKFVALTNWTGQIAFDFIQPPGYPPNAIECNPRSTSGIHLFQAQQAQQLAQALAGQTASLLSPPSGTKAYLEFPALAAWASQLPKSLHDGSLSQLRQAQSVVYRPNDIMPSLGQLLGFGELALTALYHRRPLLAQSTADFECNGIFPERPLTAAAEPVLVDSIQTLGPRSQAQ